MWGEYSSSLSHFNLVLTGSIVTYSSHQGVHQTRPFSRTLCRSNRKACLSTNSNAALATRFYLSSHSGARPHAVWGPYSSGPWVVINHGR